MQMKQIFDRKDTKRQKTAPWDPAWDRAFCHFVLALKVFVNRRPFQVLRDATNELLKTHTIPID